MTQQKVFNSLQDFGKALGVNPEESKAQEVAQSEEAPPQTPPQATAPAAAPTPAKAPVPQMLQQISALGDVTLEAIDRINREVISNLSSYLTRCKNGTNKNNKRDERVSYAFCLDSKQSGFAKQICEGLRERGAHTTLRRISDLALDGRNALRSQIIVTVPVPKETSVS